MPDGRVDDLSLRICAKCGATGRIDGQGQTKVLWEPPGAEHSDLPTLTLTRDTRVDPAGHKLVVSQGSSIHPCDRPDVRVLVTKLQVLAEAHRLRHLSAEPYLEQRADLVNELMSKLG